MNGIEVLKAAIGFNHQLTASVIGDASVDALAHRPHGSTVNPAGAVYAHAVFAEDMFIQGMMKGVQPLYQSEGWEARTGVPFPEASRQSPDWADSFRLDVETFLPYQQAVFSATEAYLDTLTDADLDRVLEAGFGKGQKVGQFLATLGVFHLSEHLGEIAAMKGIQGLKGLPF